PFTQRRLCGMRSGVGEHKGEVMIVEYVRYTIPANDKDNFVAGYTRAQEALRASPNCLGWELSQCAEDPTSFILRIEWDSTEGHMTSFRKSEQFPKFFAEVKPFLSHISEMRHYAVLRTERKK